MFDNVACKATYQDFVNDFGLANIPPILMGIRILLGIIPMLLIF